MIETWTRGDAVGGMDEAILAATGPVVARHPWWRARARLTLALLRQAGIRPPMSVLDAGCGWGVTLDHLERAGYASTGLDVSRRALRLIDRPGRRLVEADLTVDQPINVPTYDAVLALDVIEHLDDDAGAVARLARLVRPGGVLILSVPALPELYSEFDAIQGHRRRYTAETLRSAVGGPGLLLDSIRGWGGLLVPIVRRQRRRPLGLAGESPEVTYGRYLRLPSTLARLALKLAFLAEHALALSLPGRSGTSLFAVVLQGGPTQPTIDAARSTTQMRSASATATVGRSR